MSGPWWCDILHSPFAWCQALRTSTEGGSMVPSPSHPEGFPVIPPLLLEGTHVFQHFHPFCPPWCKTQSKVANFSHGNHCIQVRLVEPSLVSDMGGCLVSTGLCNLPTNFSTSYCKCVHELLFLPVKCEIYTVISHYFRRNSI